jgi:DNA repair exonuclease SbcCD ATPase subunit
MPESLWTKVRQAQRRLDFDRFVRRGIVALAVVVALAAGILLADRFFQWNLSESYLFAGAIVTAFIGTTLWNLLRPVRPVEAALRLDQSLGLKERLSTLVSLDDAIRNQPAGQALAREAATRAEGIDVAAALPMKLPRSAWWPALAAGLYLAIALGVGPIQLPGQATARETTPEEQERIQAEIKRLEQRTKEREKKLTEEGAGQELAAINADIEKAAREIKNNPKTNADQAALRLSDLAQSLEQRQEKTEHLDKMKRALAQLPRAGEGVSKKLEDSLREGDFKKAAQAIQELKKQMESGNMPADQKEKLAQQLQKLEEQLKKAANLADRAKEIQKNLSPEEAKRAMEKLAQQAKDLQQLEKLAQSLGQCSKCMNPGQGNEKGKSASGSPSDSKSLDELKKQLDNAEAILRELAQTDAERKTLEQMLQDLSECRGNVCKQEKAGNGMGKGRGAGQRPEAEDETRSRLSKARSQPTQGKSFVAGKTDGPIFAGQSQEQIKQAVSAASREADEAITHQPIPPEYKDHAREYFEKLSGEKSNP